jgi:hypothetical protein
MLTLRVTLAEPRPALRQDCVESQSASGTPLKHRPIRFATTREVATMSCGFGSPVPREARSVALAGVKIAR